MTHRTLAGLLAAAAATVLAGCTSTTTGTPQPTADSPGAAEAPLDLKNVDPCSLTTAAQRKNLNLGAGISAGDDEALGTPSCTFQIGATPGTIGVTPDFRHGIDYWQGREGKLSPTRFGGFDAVRILSPIRGCDYAVQTAPQQQLVVDYTIPDDNSKTSQQMCAQSRQFTEAALATLKTLKTRK